VEVTKLSEFSVKTTITLPAHRPAPLNHYCTYFIPLAKTQNQQLRYSYKYVLYTHPCSYFIFLSLNIKIISLWSYP